MDGDLAIYQAAFNYTGSTEFKVANEDWARSTCSTVAAR